MNGPHTFTAEPFPMANRDNSAGNYIPGTYCLIREVRPVLGDDKKPVGYLYRAESVAPAQVVGSISWWFTIGATEGNYPYCGNWAEDTSAECQLWRTAYLWETRENEERECAYCGHNVHQCACRECGTEYFPEDSDAQNTDRYCGRDCERDDSAPRSGGLSARVLQNRQNWE